MANATFQLRGVRGNRSAWGREFARFGGGTTCFTIASGNGEWIVIDGGSGLGDVAKAEFNDCTRATLLLTHFHLDHIMGIPSAPLFGQDGLPVALKAVSREGWDWQAYVRDLFAPPLWPVSLDEVKAAVSLEDLPTEDPVSISGIRVSVFALPHPQTCHAFRLQGDAASIVVATDAEFAPGVAAADFVAFAAGVDVLIVDSHFTREEYARHQGWGHSCWEAAAQLAAEAGAGQLILTHHAPDRTDAELTAIERAARKQFRNTELAYAGLTIRL